MRDLRQNLFIGTASDRYAGWIGEIYSKGRYEKGITRRSQKVGDKTFTEETLPVESVAEYFEHFPFLEIDNTFYRIELRTEAYLADPVLDVLKKHGVGVVFSHWTWLLPLRKQFAKVRTGFFNSENQVVIRFITPLRMCYEESYARAFPFDKMVPGMLDPEMIEDTAKIANEAVKDKVQVHLIINNRAGGNAPLIAQKIADRLHSENLQSLF